MATKPLIGINGDFRPAAKDATALSWFNTGYYDSIIGGQASKPDPKSRTSPTRFPFSFLPCPTTPSSSRSWACSTAWCWRDARKTWNRCGWAWTSTRRPARCLPAREDFDRRLCKMAVEMRMPILAIGGGMQLLNVICGGSIFQHIAEDCPRSLHHHDPVENTLRHVIEIVPGTARRYDLRSRRNSGQQLPSPGGESRSPRDSGSRRRRRTE